LGRSALKISHGEPIENVPGSVIDEGHEIETFEKCSIMFKFKEGENFNNRNTLSISRINKH